MTIQRNISLKPFNTFRLDAIASEFCSINSLEDFKQLLNNPLYQDKEAIIIGGGSNILLVKNPKKPVIKIDIKGKEVINEDDSTVTLRVGAGENWHDLVIFCLKNHWGGVENLSLIPGTVGAAPMQNIGAYGVEIKDVVVAVEVLMLSDLSIRTFNNADCRFGYRDSVFKNELKGQYVISHVTLRLTKTNHQFNTSYGAIKEVLTNDFGGEISLQNISEAVIKIRRSKLPDPAIIGNAGSFFKNPNIDEAHFKSLKSKYPSMPGYLVLPGLMKVPAAWLIEQCDWKGKRFGDAGVHDKQALVIVNYGNASGKEIIELARKIQQSVSKKFEIDLIPEVNIIE